MSLRFTGTFPSKEQFGTSDRGKTLPNGDKIRSIIRGYQVLPFALLVPSAENFARDARIRTTDVTNLTRRAGEIGTAGFYRAATGLPVIQHLGYAIDLQGTGSPNALAPDEDSLSSIRAADPETQQGVAEVLAANHSQQQLLGLAKAIIDKAMRPEL